MPAVLYGHGQANENLAIPIADLRLLLRHHGKMVQLRGAVDATALVSEMQWDPLGIEVIHLDLIRVDLKEKVEVSVSIRTHGEPIGVQEGGMFLQNLHEVDIRCPAGSIPDYVTLEIAGLHLGEHLLAGDLELPEGAELLTNASTVAANRRAATRGTRRGDRRRRSSRCRTRIDWGGYRKDRGIVDATMKLIVGLGNPGRKYEQTRHNVGFMAAAKLAALISATPARIKFEGEFAEGTAEGEKLLVLCPHTYMNASGQSVRKAIDFYKISTDDLLVICDDFQSRQR